MIKPSQAITVGFETASPTTGAAADASSLPAGVLVKNGTDTAVTVTVTNKATGSYKAAVTIPSDAAPGDRYEIRVEATVATVAGKATIWGDIVADTIAVSNVTQVNGTAITPVTGNIPSEVKAIDSTVQSSLITAIWAASTRTLTSLGTVVADTAAAVWAVTVRTITGGALTTAPPTAAQIRTEMETAGGTLAAVKADTSSADTKLDTIITGQGG